MSRCWILSQRQSKPKRHTDHTFPPEPWIFNGTRYLRNLLISHFCYAIQVTRINGDLYFSTHKFATSIWISTQILTTLQNALLWVPTPYQCHRLWQFCFPSSFQFRETSLLSCSLLRKPACPTQLSSYWTSDKYIGPQSAKGRGFCLGALQKGSEVWAVSIPLQASFPKPVLSCLLSFSFLAQLGTEAHSWGASGLAF